MNQFIFVRTSFEAIHAWPECPFKEVGFLKNPHRHIFHVEAKWKVTNDRQIEFLMQKNMLNEFLLKKYHQKDLGSASCERIAQDIISELHADVVSVSEDDENGVECYAI